MNKILNLDNVDLYNTLYGLETLSQRVGCTPDEYCMQSIIYE